MTGARPPKSATLDGIAGNYLAVMAASEPCAGHVDASDLDAEALRARLSAASGAAN